MDLPFHPIFLFFILPVWLQGSDPSEKIKHKNNETAILGGNVTMFCNLTTPADVVQVTWQKIQGSLPQNIGTYSRKYGEKILPPYEDRLQCKTIEPNCSFITIHDVTFEDEACYKCLFNVFPWGSHGGQICLNIITISVLRMELETNHEDIVRFIYSAVGKPAPQISVFPSEVLNSPPEESLAQNLNGTVTITKIFNISWESLKVLNIQKLVVQMDHPLRKEKKDVLLPVKNDVLPVMQESITIGRLRTVGCASVILFLLILIVIFCIWRMKK